MKPLLSLLIFITSISNGFAQSNLKTSEHLTFKGIPIDGPLNEFVSKLKSEGYSHIGTENGVAIFEAEFAGYKECYIAAYTLEQIDIVSKVAVIFPSKETWENVSYNYSFLKELLTEKYGAPEEEIEKFESTYPPEDDNSKMHEIFMNRCNYYSIYELEEGSIQISIEKGDMSDAFVRLVYFDKLNGDIVRKKALDDL